MGGLEDVEGIDTCWADSLDTGAAAITDGFCCCWSVGGAVAGGAGSGGAAGLIG